MENLWTCPKCKRQFKRKNQNHSCGEKVTSIDEYLEYFSGTKKEVLTELRNIIKNAIPNAKEKISWGMPTFYDRKNIIHFAGHKNHYSIYGGEKVPRVFEDELKDYECTKGTIKLNYDQLPKELIEKIAKYCEENQDI